MPTWRNSSTAFSLATLVADIAVCAYRFGHLDADLNDRVQRRGRVLKDHRDPASTDRPQLAVSHLIDVPAPEPDLAFLDRAGRRNHLEQ